MTPTDVLICNLGDHEIARQLGAIIQSNIQSDVRIIEGIQKIPSANPPKLVFFVLDENQPCGNNGITGIAIPFKIAVISSKSIGKLDSDNLADRFDDFIFAPLREDEVICRIGRLMGVVEKDEKENAKRNILQELGMAQVIGQDPAFLEVISKIQMVSNSDVTVLLTGETGVGKEVCARAIHYLSERSVMPFIPVNCGAIPANLVENELFGHRKGAYTDARHNQFGVITEAEKGTLFLDEIDALSLEAQSKLLRLLQERTYRPLGQSKVVSADIRVIVASNVDLKQKMEEGIFRQDLYYRLSVPLPLPPLRERKSDIPLLANHFLEKHGTEDIRSQKTLSQSAIQKLLLYEWPGNIRELESIIQLAILLTPGSKIASENINLPITTDTVNPNKKVSFTEAKRGVIEAFEKEYITRQLIACNGNITLNLSPDSYHPISH
jgi:DNA-binding NtrC family response regulator